MDLLINEDAVKARMALPEVADTSDFINSAIVASQLWVEQKWGSPISKVTGQVDKFFLDATRNNNVRPNGFFRLKLRRGLLTAAPVVKASILWNASGADLITLVEGTDYMVDLEQGIVRVDGINSNSLATWVGGSSSWWDNYVTDTYNAGYEAGDDLPDWLAEAILAYVPAVFNWAPSTQRDPEAEAGYKASADHAEAVMALHMRTKATVIRPL